MIDRIWKMLCLKADTCMSFIGLSVLTRKLDRLIGNIQLHTRLVGKTGHTDAAF